MKTKMITDADWVRYEFKAVNLHDGSDLDEFPQGWKVQYNETILNGMTNDLFDAIQLGICECIMGFTMCGMAPFDPPPDTIDIPPTKIIRGGISTVQISFTQKIATIIGYFSFGTFSHNATPVVVIPFDIKSE